MWNLDWMSIQYGEKLDDADLRIMSFIKDHSFFGWWPMPAGKIFDEKKRPRKEGLKMNLSHSA